MAKFTKLSFCQKLFFWHKTSSCKCSMCLYYVGKVSDSFSKSSSTSWCPRACSIWALTKPLLSSKVLKKSSKRCHFVKKYFYGIKLLHANVQYVYIVYAKCQMASVKALVQVVFLCLYYLSTNKTLIKKQCKKCCHFVKKYFYGIKLLHANVQCVDTVYTKYQDISVKAVEQVEFHLCNIKDYKGQ